MKKAIITTLLGLMLVMTLVAATDVTGAPENTRTIIAGKIYNVDYTDVIEGAKVEVTCGNDEDGYNTLTMFSLPDGAYRVEFNSTNGFCLVDDSLSVYAEKDGLTGQKDGIVKAAGTCENTPGPDTENCLINVFDDVNVAVVNVPLVPEFGTVVGVLTILSAVGVFFVVRKR